MIDMSKRAGPFLGISKDVTRKFPNNRTLRFVLYGAYNAMGLIGPEKNGIAILDEDRRQVVVDEIGCEASGYHGPSAKQFALFEDLTSEKTTFESLSELVEASPRARVFLDA